MYIVVIMYNQGTALWLFSTIVHYEATVYTLFMINL